MEAISNFGVMSGRIGNRYNINMDARMCRKAFMQAHAIKQFGGKVFWIDADTITHSKVPETFLDDVLPDDKLCCYLGRDWMYTESGFLGFNADHPLCESFMRTYLQIFISGAIFTQPGWHDCYGFDAARKIHRADADAFADLAKDLPEGTMHPFVNTILGAYMDHRKGPRKEGKSTDADLVVARNEPYWKDSQPEKSQPIISLDTNLPPSSYKAASSMPPAG